MDRKRKILLIEDEQDSCFFTKMNLEKTGKFSVIALSDSQEAEDVCLREKPDLVLLDLVMPKKDGFHILKKFKDNPLIQKMPIIITSGLGREAFLISQYDWSWKPKYFITDHYKEPIEESDAESGKPAYIVEAFLAKPYSAETLRRTIEEVLREF